MTAKKNAAPKRTNEDKAADKAAATSIVADLARIRDDNRAALRALPAAGSRTAAQRRDALAFQLSIVTARALRMILGVTSTADRDGTADT